MAQIVNRTKAPLGFSIVGDVYRTKEYRTVIPGKDGAPPEVVAHEVQERRTGHVKSVLLPPSVDGQQGVLDLDREDLKNLKQQEGFMAAVKRGDINITEH